MRFRFGLGRLDANPKPIWRMDFSVQTAFLDAPGRNGHKPRLRPTVQLRPETAPGH
jgi:hypothetical protein